MLKALLIKLYNSRFNGKTVNLVFLASKAYRRVISFYLSYDKPHEKLALGQNCIKIISDKSNSVAMFLRIQAELLKLNVT